MTPWKYKRENLTRASCLASVAAFAGIFYACVHKSDSIVKTINPVYAKARPDQTPEAQLTRFEEHVSGHQSLEVLLQDVRSILEAQVAERAQEKEKAKAAWWTALGSSSGSTDDIALKGWIRSYAALLPKPINREVFAKLILAETKGGHYAPIMLEKGLTQDAKIISYLDSTIADSLEPNASVMLAAAAPVGSGIPTDDPLLLGASSSLCQSTTAIPAEWSRWLQTLSLPVSQYFQALIAQCSGKLGQAKLAVLFEESAERLETSKYTMPIAIEAYSRAIKIKRDQGERETVAPLYLNLTKAWHVKGIRETSFGMSRRSFEKRRIEDFLWAARYRLLVGDTENAKIFAQEALSYVSSALTAPALTEDQKKEFGSLAAEAHHFLAFRIALEAGDFTKASAINMLALESPHLNDEWLWRLSFYAGMYDFLSGNFDSARRRWEMLLSNQPDESNRPTVLFWLARVNRSLGFEDQAKAFAKSLVEDFPLSFYSTQGLTLAEINPGIQWRDIFGSPDKLLTMLQVDDAARPGLLLEDEKAQRLTRRAEALATMSIDKFAKGAIDELVSYVTNNSNSDESLRQLVYCTRLYSSIGAHIEAIALTTKASKASNFWQRYPQQILVAFPRPWLDVYRRATVDTGVDVFQLLAISRQESGFNSEARSSAGAFGVMQLIPPTARRMSKLSGVESTALDHDLLRPEFNILLGSYYVKELSKRYNGQLASVYSAYNAGEATSDLWLNRRQFKDQVTFIELLPYQETKGYVRNVLRNLAVYRWLDSAFPIQAADL